MDNPNREVINFTEWIKIRVKILGANETTALRAGELKKMLHITLPDCYIIASAETINATPVFKKIEEEMKPIIRNLRRLGVKFFGEIEL